MRLNLFHIPGELLGWPVFGFGWLLLVWAIASLMAIALKLQKPNAQAEIWGLVPSILLSGGLIAFLLPRLVDAAGLPVRGYGVMLLAAIGSAIGLAVYRARRAGLDPELIYSIAFSLVVWGVIGARLFFVVQYWPQFQRPTLPQTIMAILSFNEGGLVVYGSLLAGAAALILFLRKHRLPFLPFADLVVPSVVLGMGVGRLGCFLTGCCFGAECDLPWKVTFPIGSPPYVDQASRGLLPIDGILFSTTPAPPVVSGLTDDSPAKLAGLKTGDEISEVRVTGNESAALLDWYRGSNSEEAVELLLRAGPERTVAIKLANRPGEISWSRAPASSRSLPIHPVQIYSFLDALLLCGFLLAFAPLARRDGEVAAWALTLHPISRFMLEMLRNDEAPVWGTPFHISQNISLILFAVGLAMWGYVLSRPAGRLSFAAIQPAQ